MKITFPHMGNTYIAVKAMFEDFGLEVVVPPKCSKRTLELGTKYSPESICLPLKINIGNYIESIEKGADTILITGSCGPCRFGFYPVIEREILKDLGYDVDIIVFDPPDGNYKELINNITRAVNTKNPIKMLKSFNRGRIILKEVDKLFEFSNKIRAYAVNSYEVDEIMQRFSEDVLKVKGVIETRKLIRRTFEELEKVEIDNTKRPLRIGIVGEIYTVIEPYVNLDIERKLGHMGVWVDKFLTTSRWVEHNLKPSFLGLSEEKKAWEAAKPYIRTLVGGHGRETVGSAIMYAEKGYDGVIQLLPFSCMPEIVAETILKTVRKDYDIPILTLIVDELTGETGYVTRLEAFVDLLKRRREERNFERVLFRS
ncbi:Predicted nucleotide-binding protein, sugar kinase/HSP70/actin superfamily [Caloranaerobacter azorensis DSM 13643]|uniref:Predicted nucleotide-binding protein, sugar kinase/HSP70/actin superfamily n=1 Tax=Caloranaerobacter azorensis DSM 13643 TaxID=1121264 RepID=A0A1M5UM22_9FIRM|nr:acyl-CoA dehydratase activase-related protein [Caloranaerobacter azorensis]SHH64059.1 Predicted nucleotide-binding protein, sugar kinase/HSP70/actin superfamily [Caloranaerobacter azorensis DSM 13643]